MVGQISGTSYGYLQGQQSPSSSQIYNPVQQQLQSPSYSAAAQFDPLVQGWSSNTPSSTQQPQLSSFAAAPTSPTSSITTSRSATGAVHPREYIKTYKAEIERWDSYAWKQFLNSYDDLKEAWATRKQEVHGRAQQLLTQMQYGGGGYYPQMQQEAERLQGLSKEADLNHDSVAASSFQIHEVFQNYRQSGDAASKRRVREASNAALQSLPDWPSPAF